MRLKTSGIWLLWGCACAAHAAGQVDSSATVLRQDAAEAYRTQNWSRAEQLLSQFIESYPRDPWTTEAVFSRAESSVMLKHFAEAKADYTRYLAGSPDPSSINHRWAEFRLGEVHVLLGDYNEAARLLSEFTFRHPQDQLNTYALPHLGELALRRGDAEQGRQYFVRATRDFPHARTERRCREGLAKAESLLQPSEPPSSPPQASQTKTTPSHDSQRKTSQRHAPPAPTNEPEDRGTATLSEPRLSPKPTQDARAPYRCLLTEASPEEAANHWQSIAAQRALNHDRDAALEALAQALELAPTAPGADQILARIAAIDAPSPQK